MAWCLIGIARGDELFGLFALQDDEQRLQILHEISKPFVASHQPGVDEQVDRRGRCFADALASPCSQTVGLAPVQRKRHANGLVFRRLLMPLWSDALAAGKKWVEVQRYKSKTLNQLKFADESKMIVFGPSQANFGQVHGLAILRSKAQKNLAKPDILKCLPLMSDDLHDDFKSYVEDGTVFDIVEVAKVYDLRTFGWTWTSLANALGVAMPKQTQGFPVVGGEDCRDRLLKLCSAAPQYTRESPLDGGRADTAGKVMSLLGGLYESGNDEMQRVVGESFAAIMSRPNGSGNSPAAGSGR